jgi:cytochrome b561
VQSRVIEIYAVNCLIERRGYGEWVVVASVPLVRCLVRQSRPSESGVLGTAIGGERSGWESGRLVNVPMMLFVMMGSLSVYGLLLVRSKRAKASCFVLERIYRSFDTLAT